MQGVRCDCDAMSASAGPGFSKSSAVPRLAVLNSKKVGISISFKYISAESCVIGAHTHCRDESSGSRERMTAPEGQGCIHGAASGGRGVECCVCNLAVNEAPHTTPACIQFIGFCNSINFQEGGRTADTPAVEVWRNSVWKGSSELALTCK